MKRFGVWVLAATSVTGCGASHHHGSDPHGHDAHHEHHDHPPGPFSHAEQRVGHAGHARDGLVLRSVRHAAHHGFHRFVFDVSLPRGDAHHIPLAVATYHAHDFSIDIDIEGIDRDVTGHGIHTPVKVARGPVARFERLGHDHHHHARYRIQLTRGARYRLHALHAPVRIVLDVEKSDLER